MKKISKLILKRINKLHESLSKKKILVLGDSHAAVFENFRFKWMFPSIYFDVVSVGGATASGLENPRSKTNAYNIFNENLRNNDYDAVILLLGEVDTGFVIWYRAKKYNTSMTEMFEKTIQTYTSFIKKVSSYSKTIVISTPLPTIDDNSMGEVATLRANIQCSQRERTELTLRFNKEVEVFCKKHNITYIDLDKKSLGKDGLVKSSLKNRNILDHHYDKNKYSLLLIGELEPYINSL